MAERIFDRETLLDLVVNGVPLFILLFFFVVFLALPYFGLGGLASAQMLLIVGLSFVALAILTYLAARAIAGSEAAGEVYLPGQAGVDGAEPLEERERSLREE